MTANVPALPMCEVCPDPGRCCRKMYLHGGPVGGPQMGWGLRTKTSRLAALVASAVNMLPMVPAGFVEDGDMCHWFYSCPELQPNGRCGIYEHRPQVCRDFKPGSDRLCVYHVTPPEPEAAPLPVVLVDNG